MYSHCDENFCNRFIKDIHNLLENRFQNKFSQKIICCHNSSMIIIEYIYLGFYVAFNTVQVIFMTGNWKGRGNQYIQLVKVLYCKLPSNGKQLPAFPLEAVPVTEPRPQRWEVRVQPLCHRGPMIIIEINSSVPTAK